MKRIIFLSFLLIFVSRFFLSISPAFFDSLEYLHLAQRASFVEAWRAAHFPIHPFFVSFIWLVNQIPISTTLFKIEFFNGLLGFLTAILIYKISRRFLSQKQALWLTLFCSFSPYFWLSQINVLYEPLLNLFLLAGFYYSGFFFAIAFLVAPSSLVFLLLIPRKKLLTYVFYLLPALVVYLIILELRDVPLTNLGTALFASNSLLGKIQAENWLFFPRVIRNAAVIYFNYLTWPLGLVAFFLAIKEKNRVFIINWLLAFLLLSSFWHAGMYGRLALLLTLAPFYLLAKIKNQWLVFGLFILLLVQSARIVLPYYFQPVPYWQEKEYLESLPNKNILLVISNYEEPYLKEGFDYLVLNSPRTNLGEIKNQIDLALTQKREVLFTSQAVTTPYFQYDGWQYQLLSKRKNHPQTEGEKLISHYQIKIIKNWSNHDLQIFHLN